MFKKKNMFSGGLTMKGEWQVRITKFLFSALFIFLSLLLISCSSDVVSSNVSSNDDSNNDPSSEACDSFTTCFEQEIDTTCDGIFDSWKRSCYTYDDNGNRITAFIEYDEGANDSIEQRTTVSYDYDWDNNVLTMDSTSTNADGNTIRLEQFTWLLDTDGNRIEGDIEIDKDADGSADEYRKEYLTYDNGEVSSWVVEIYNDVDGPMVSSSTRTYTYTRIYDESTGNILEFELVIALDHGSDEIVDAHQRFTYAYEDGNRISCDIEYYNALFGFTEATGTSYYTNDGNKTKEEGEMDGCSNGTIDFKWTNSWDNEKICSSNLSKPLDPLYVLK
jgi:hypothetical protein